MSNRFSPAMLLALACAPSYAADCKPLEGPAAIAALNDLDPEKGEATDSHWRVQLEGATARDLFVSTDLRRQKIDHGVAC